MLFDQLGDLFNGQLLIKYLFRIYEHDGAFSAEPVAAGKDYLYLIRESLLFEFSL